MNTVMSLEKDSEEEWMQSKLKLWKRGGYSIDSIEKKISNNPEDSIDIIAKYDSLFQRGEIVRDKMRSLPRNLEKKRHSLVEKLRNLDDIPTIENIVLQLLEEYRPWMLIIEKNITGWKMHDELDTLNNLISRLNNLDPSMIVDAKSVSQYFVDPRMKDRIEKEIVKIENRQNKRAIVLNEMEELLSKEGFETYNLGDLTLEKRFDEINKIQNEQKKHLKLKQQINHGIRIFDSNIAEGLDERRLQLLNSDDHAAFLKLKNEVTEISKVFFDRLDIINKKIREWREIGIEFENMGPISANELYSWEKAIPEMQERIDVLLVLRKRLIKQNEIWADEIDNALLGIRRIDLIDKLEAAVVSLENKTDLMNIEFDSFIDTWKKRGYDMQKWLGRYSKNPRETIAELKAFAPVLEEGEILRSRIKELDTEMLQKEKRSKLLEILKNSDIELNTLIEIDNEIRLLEKRQFRYYEKLTNEWENLVGNNQALRKIDTTDWSISKFELEISKVLDDNLGSLTKTKFVSSMKKSLKEEFSLLEKQGWDMTELYLQLENSPEKLGDSLPLIRKQISEYERLVSRLLVLPWERSPDKAKLILNQLKMPEKLPKIWEMIPSLIKELSSLEIIDDNFEFSPWRPDNIVEFQNTNTITIFNKEDEVVIEENKKDRVTEQVEKVIVVNDNEIDDEFDLEFWEKYSLELKTFAKTLGIDLGIWPIENDEGVNSWRRILAKNVGYTPRDTRVDRLLRLSLRCIPLQDCNYEHLKDYLYLIKTLTKSAKRIHRWTKTRLDYRNNIGSDSLLDDAIKLGEVLNRVPGPGVNLPLDKDVFSLPQASNLEELKNECDALLKICI